MKWSWGRETKFLTRVSLGSSLVRWVSCHVEKGFCKPLPAGGPGQEALAAKEGTCALTKSGFITLT